MAFNSWKKDLHEGFQIIACPLFEVTALGKPSQTREWRYSSNSDLLWEDVIELMNEVTYLRSMSLIISSARLVPCTALRYFATQLTRWSLKAPLMSWWRRSNDSNSWISARRKSFVNGYTKYISLGLRGSWFPLTTRSLMIPYSSHNISSCSSPIMKSVCSQQRYMPPLSRSVQIAIHLTYMISTSGYWLQVPILTSGTNA